MTADPDEFRGRYAAAFRHHLEAGDEAGLELAYELGRTAVTEGVSLLDFAAIHHEVLAEGIAGAGSRPEMARIAAAGAGFFKESLATFEMTQRGFREAHESAQLQRQIAVTLQRNLLPEALPDLPAVSAAARYVAGADGVEVGGDWYEVLPLPGERVGVAIGDVVGRGVRAAAIMGQLRVALRVYALEFQEPAEVAQRLARFAHAMGAEQMTTFVYAVLDPASGKLSFVNAGHPPPLVLAADGDAFLQGPTGVPLGVASHVAYEEAETELAAGATLLLYTDGLVERRGEALDAGLERLRDAATSAPVEPDALCDSLIEALAADGTSDDVALLALHSQPAPTDTLALSLEAESSSLRVLRRRLQAWLPASGATHDDTEAIVLAAGEAAANAIEHAYGPGDASFEVEARRDGGEVEVVVRDFGRWRPPRVGFRGHGQGVMRDTMDSVEIESGDGGTTVRLRRRVGGR